ncbi:MAG: hypothetical protein NT091_03560, partial [Candidatus Falkowbacteria bacterium]|nr:hypothetical protein [Candidatus Falkowbacteria bacterium]
MILPEFLFRWCPRRVALFGRTRNPNAKDHTKPCDAQLIINSGVGTAVIVCKSRLLDVINDLRVTAKNNLSLIAESITMLKNAGLRVIIDLEHAIDAFKGVYSYGKKLPEEDVLKSQQHVTDIIELAGNAGADCIVLCDTNGGASPLEIKSIFRYICSEFPTLRFGFHGHNDLGLSVQNSITALRCGACHIQGTVGGIGERVGNTDWITLVVMTYQHHKDINIIPEEAFDRLTQLAQAVSSCFG